MCGNLEGRENTWNWADVIWRLGLGSGEWVADHFFCLYVPVYVPEWASAWLYKQCHTCNVLGCFPTSHTNFQGLSELFLNPVHFFKINMKKIKTIILIT